MVVHDSTPIQSSMASKKASSTVLPNVSRRSMYDYPLLHAVECRSTWKAGLPQATTEALGMPPDPSIHPSIPQIHISRPEASIIPLLDARLWCV